MLRYPLGLHLLCHVVSPSGGAASEVSCGGHAAMTCAACVESQPAEDAKNFCNGDCMWTGVSCITREDRAVSCGGHRAADCAHCPDGHGGGWCHGDCLWLAEECVSATGRNREAAKKEHRKVQSQPRLRSSFATGGAGILNWMDWLVGPRSEPEPTPEELYTGYVRNLVGTTISHTVQDAGKDVPVNCYAPWCGHCQRFKPLYKELAKRLSHVRTLIVSQIDCTQNDLGPLRGYVSVYPTIALFPSGGTGRIDLYVGSRRPDDMIKWLHTNVGKSFSDTPLDEVNDSWGQGPSEKDDDL